MSKAYKGGDYEREICKTLSLWWTEGERDDVFWRSSQSGGRATQRAKQGLRTHGSYGDIAAVDPIGEPLLKFVTLELKRGSSHSTPYDTFDTGPTKSIRPFELALNQAYDSHSQAGSMGWAIIARRDSRKSIIYLQWELMKLLGRKIAPSVIFDIYVNRVDDFTQRMKFIAIGLDQFLKEVPPDEIMLCTEN